MSVSIGVGFSLHIGVSVVLGVYGVCVCVNLNATICTLISKAVYKKVHIMMVHNAQRTYKKADNSLPQSRARETSLTAFVLTSSIRLGMRHIKCAHNSMT